MEKKRKPRSVWWEQDALFPDILLPNQISNKSWELTGEQLLHKALFWETLSDLQDTYAPRLQKGRYRKERKAILEWFEGIEYSDIITFDMVCVSLNMNRPEFRRIIDTLTYIWEHNEGTYPIVSPRRVMNSIRRVGAAWCKSHNTYEAFLDW